MNQNYPNSLPGWFRRSFSVLLGLFFLVSSHALGSAPAINALATESKGELDKYSGAVIPLVVAFVVLGLLSFVAYSLFQIINQPSE